MSIYGKDYPEVIDPGPDDNPTVDTWRPQDPTSVLNGTWRPPVPTVGHRSDGLGLFYRGKQHTVASESEAGKTWFVLSATQDELQAGNHVVYLDFEDDLGSTITRLRAIGVPREMIVSHFHYIRPEEPLSSQNGLMRLGEVMATQPTLAVIDGVTEAMTLHGLDPINNSDCAHFGRMLPRRLAEWGAATVSLDHVTKSVETRRHYAIGAVHKLNGLNGAAFVLENVAPFGIGVTGRSRIRIAKDRPGQLRRSSVPGSMFWFADLVINSHAPEFAEIDVASPSQNGVSTFRPTILMARLWQCVSANGPIAKRNAMDMVGGNREQLSRAFNLLIMEGYITKDTPHSAVKQFAEDPRDQRDQPVTTP